MADLGIGTAHDGPTPTTESLSAALRTILTAPDPRTSNRRSRHDPGDELRAEVVGPGEIRFIRVSDPLEVLDELATRSRACTRPATSMS